MTLTANEDRPVLHSTFPMGQFEELSAATLWAEFRIVEEGFETELLTGLLEAVPTLLPSIDESDFLERLKKLGRALQLHDWRVSAQNEMRLNGREEILRFLRTVPLLTEEEVCARNHSEQRIELSELLQITCAGERLYYSDQFGSDGSIHPECIEVRRILKKTDTTDWEIAIWWISPVGWLDEMCPRDIYKENPAALRDAAEQEVAVQVG
jgi:hypothetical protein